MNWVKHEDLNTVFFLHKTASMRNRKNTILRLELEGKIIEDEDRIRWILHKHLRVAFGSKAVHRWSGRILFCPNQKEGWRDSRILAKP